MDVEYVCVCEKQRGYKEDILRIMMKWRYYSDKNESVFIFTFIIMIIIFVVAGIDFDAIAVDDVTFDVEVSVVSEILRWVELSIVDILSIEQNLFSFAGENYNLFFTFSPLPPSLSPVGISLSGDDAMKLHEQSINFALQALNGLSVTDMADVVILAVSVGIRCISIRRHVHIQFTNCTWNERCSVACGSGRQSTRVRERESELDS